MSEKAPRTPERSVEAPRPSRQETLQPKAEAAAEKLEHKKIDTGEAAKAVEAQANSSQDILKSIGGETSSEASAATNPTYTNAKLSEHGYRNILRETRRSLSKPSQQFSKIIHNPVIEKVSESTSKTVARPSAFLGGALVSLIGSIVILLIARRNGFVVTPFIFPLLFSIGYIGGLGLDMIFSGARKIAK